MICPHCKKDTVLKNSDPEEYKRKQRANMERCRLKRAANGSQIGAVRKFDYGKIRELHMNGLSLRKIAHRIGCSCTTVVAALKAPTRKPRNELLPMGKNL